MGYIIDIQITISQLLFPSFFFFPPLFHIFRRLSLPIPDEWDVLPASSSIEFFANKRNCGDKIWKERKNIHLKLNKQMAPAETRQLLCVNS
jgi:hypothetical protein